MTSARARTKSSRSKVLPNQRSFPSQVASGCSTPAMFRAALVPRASGMNVPAPKQSPIQNIWDMQMLTFCKAPIFLGDKQVLRKTPAFQELPLLENKVCVRCCWYTSEYRLPDYLSHNWHCSNRNIIILPQAGCCQRDNQPTEQKTIVNCRKKIPAT